MPRVPFHLTPRPLSLLPSTRRSFTTSRTRLNTNTSSSQQPSSYREGMSRYKTFASPFAKVFLGAIFTYQVIYWTWVKLEMEEVKAEKNREVTALEKEVRQLTGHGQGQGQEQK